MNDLKTANLYLKNRYGEKCSLKEFQGLKKQKSVTKYTFVNLPLMKNYPYDGFYSIEKAMNCLFAHEDGFIKNLKKNTN